MFFDKAKIKSNFNQAQKSYNPNAILQRMVAKNLVDLAKQDIFKAENIIDLGAGTGFICEEILVNKKVWENHFKSVEVKEYIGQKAQAISKWSLHCLAPHSFYLYA